MSSMKHIQLLLLLFAFSMTASAQVKVDIQAGGANFLGLSINTELDIPVNREKGHVLMPRLGVGMLIPGLYSASSLVHVGLHYRIRKIGLGCEASGFFQNPFDRKGASNDHPADILVYPNLNYTFSFSKFPYLYLRISGGVYFAFDKVRDLLSDNEGLEWQGDPIPGAGLTFGYAF